MVREVGDQRLRLRARRQQEQQEEEERPHLSIAVE
jgi:hypothetical protein